MKTKRIAVITLSHARFRRFTAEMPIEDRELFILIRDSVDMLGRDFIGVVRIGAYWKVENHEAIYDEILAKIKW